MSAALRKGGWALTYDDGNDKVTVSFDTTSEHCPASINVEYSSDQWIYVDAEDAAEEIRKTRGETL